MSDSLATTIGETLGKGALSSAGGVALGQILLLAGADFSGQAEMSRKLDQILAELDKLRTAVESLTEHLQEVEADLAYDLSVNSVLGLINVNKTLNDAFRDLLIAKPEELVRMKKDITGKLEKLTDGLATWDNCLRGVSGQTGLIHGWARKVRANCKNWFSAHSASAIQSHWDYYDAQQALTVAYLVDYYHQSEPTKARSTLETWRNC
jgi:prefoldin subunit 5